MSTPTYLLGPRSTRGVLLGLSGPRIGVLGVGAVVGIGALVANDLAVALVAVVITSAVAFIRIGGRDLVSWWRPISRTASTTLRHRNVWRAPLPYAEAHPVGAEGDVVPYDAPALPAEWGARRHLDVVVDGRALGVAIEQTSEGRLASVALVAAGPSLALVGDEARAGTLRNWGAFLAELTTAKGTLVRLQVLERTAPVEVPLPEGDPSPAAASYAAVEAEAARLGATHSVVLVPTWRLKAKGRAGAAEAAEAAVAFVRRLNGAGIPASPLGSAERAAWCRATVTGGPVGAPLPVGAAGPVARKRTWSHVVTDGTCHALFSVAAWPRMEVGPAWLAPLLLGRTSATRTFSLVLEPVPPDAALRAAEGEVSAQALDQTQRARAGFAARARHVRQAAAAKAREEELVAGHGAYRFAGLVGVSAPDEARLAEAVGELVAQASQSQLLLHRLYGLSDEALAALAPLGRARLARRWA